jgi:hypothetical protein
VSLGFAFYGISIIAELGVMNTLLMTVFLWAVLSSFCSLCVVYWVAKDDEQITASIKVVDDNFAFVDERLKKLEAQQKNIEEQK